MRFGKALKIALVRQEKNQDWLAKQVGVSKAYLSAICCDHKTISIKKADYFASKLGMKLSELIAIAEEEQ